uniref:MICOS complex subunit MIC10 n=1 Tax=Zea mays TaxID=4577 RepID=C0PIT9_MAIZE|nr:unknown [Zea mays]
MAEAPETAAPTQPPPAPAASSPPPKSGIPPRYDLDAKWDACLDLSIRRVAYSSLGGAFAGLLLFRKDTPPVACCLVRSGCGLLARCLSWIACPVRLLVFAPF